MAQCNGATLENSNKAKGQYCPHCGHIVDLRRVVDPAEALPPLYSVVAQVHPTMAAPAPRPQPTISTVIGIMLVGILVGMTWGVALLKAFDGKH